MNVAASTQNQAFSALLLLYQEVLKLRLPWIEDIVRILADRRAKNSMLGIPAQILIDR